MNKLKNPDIKVNVDESGIFHLEFISPDHIDLEIAMHGFRKSKGMFRDGKRPALIDISRISYMDKEARDLFSGKFTTQFISRMAILSKNTVSTVIGNFFIGINKPSFPVNLFQDKDQALDWLLQK